ncbi:MAG: hypothetical protein AB3X44_13415 [Leptothrix sp. (in: b-proteobacteria)]
MSIDCLQSSLCFEMAKGFPAAFVALMVGLVATYIAWKQYATARAKVKLDLFQRRYEIFERTWRHLSEAIQTSPGPTPFSDFDNFIPQAGFLFGAEVEAYLRNISSKRIELWAIHSKTKSSCDVMAAEDVERHTELMKWFYAEASEGIRRVFAPWLDLKDWK